MGYSLLLTQGTEVCGLALLGLLVLLQAEIYLLVYFLFFPVIVIYQSFSFSFRPACNGCKAGYIADAWLHPSVLMIPKYLSPTHKSTQHLEKHCCSYREAWNGIFITKLWNKRLPTITTRCFTQCFILHFTPSVVNCACVHSWLYWPGKQQGQLSTGQ